MADTELNVKSGKWDLKYHLLLLSQLMHFLCVSVAFLSLLPMGTSPNPWILTLLWTVLSANILGPTSADLEPVQIHRQVDIFLSCSAPSFTGNNRIRASQTASSWQYQSNRRRLLHPPLSPACFRRASLICRGCRDVVVFFFHFSI